MSWTSEVISNADTWCYEFIDSNFNYTGDIQVVIGAPGQDRRGFIDFDISGETKVGLVKVELFLYVSSAPPSGTETLYAKRCTSSWSESVVKWSTQPSVTTTNQASVSYSTTGYKVITVTNLVTDIIDNTDYGIALYASASAVGQTTIDDRNDTNYPYLKFTYSSCRATGTLFSGSQYTGWGVIQNIEQECSGTSSVLVNIEDAWGVDQGTFVMNEGETETFTSGSEVYSVECTQIFCSGEVLWSDFTECWYTDDGNRYITTTGSDSNKGINWIEPWLTMGYGFQNIPSGKDLYIEEGLYGGETLSNINPPQTTSVYIQPSGHTEAQCNVFVSDDTAFSDGSFSGSSVSNWSTSDITIIDPFQTISFTGGLHALSYYAANAGTRKIKVKIFRDDGTNYNFIGESDFYSFAGAVPGVFYDYKQCNIQVQVGDIIGIYLDGGALAVGNLGSNFLVSKSGDIISNSTKASWSTSGTFRTPIQVGVRGFK